MLTDGSNETDFSRARRCQCVGFDCLTLASAPRYHGQNVSLEASSSPAHLPATRIAGPWERAAPNLLTGARVVLAVAFFAILTPWRYHKSPLSRGDGPDFWLLAAALIFSIAAITDALDGYLARRFNAITTFGRIMDPFADKFLVIGAFVFLAGPGFTYTGEAIMHLPNRTPPPDWATGSVTGVQAWMVALILGRELLVTSIRAEVEGRGISFGATWSGKFKMILQSICIPAVLVLMNIADLNGPDAHRPGKFASYAMIMLVWATVLVTVWSAVPYIAHALRALRPAGTPRA